MGGSHQKIKFNEPNGFKLKNADFSMGSLHLGFKNRLKNDDLYGLRIQQQQTPYLRALTSTELKMENPWIPSVSFDYDKKKKKNTGLFRHESFLSRGKRTARL